MGYSYGRTASGRWALSCDGCGVSGGVRKRTCPHRVHYAEGGSLPYCYPAALCAACYTKHRATLHATCADGAAKANAREAARKVALDAGALEVKTAWGDWHPAVPKGFVAVRFVGKSGEVYRLVPDDDYDPRVRRYLTDYPDATAIEPLDPPTKEVRIA